MDVRAELLRCLLAGPNYGVVVAEQIKTRTGEDLDQWTLYPALRGLERDGLVVSWEGPPVVARGHRPRRFYRLTDRGQAVVAGIGELGARELEPQALTHQGLMSKFEAWMHRSARRLRFYKP